MFIYLVKVSGVKLEVSGDLLELGIFGHRGFVKLSKSLLLSVIEMLIFFFF